jgi:putative ABC transport system substrate-binding protein
MAHTPAALRQALAELGYIEGKNVTYVGRWAESMRERLPALAVELVDLKVDVIVTVTSGAAMAARNASSAIPIVMALSTDPMGQGLIASLARPGGNVTGMSDNAIDLSAKRLQLLREAVPTASRIAVLWNERDRAMTQRYREIDRAAQALGMSVQPLGVREPDDFERAFSAMNRERPDAMIMVTDVLTNRNRKRVLDYAEAHRIPAMYEFASFVHEGGLMS